MNLSLCTIIYCLTVSCLTSALVNENLNSKKSSPKNQPKGDLNNDDEDAGGSGFGEERYDLESSGSGYGPDDEDTDHEHGSPAKINPKFGERGGDSRGTIPYPSSPGKSVSSTSQPSPKPISEPLPTLHGNMPSVSEKTTHDENKNTLHNFNVNPPATENENRAITPNKVAEGEANFDNRHTDDKNVEGDKLDTSGVYKVNTPVHDRATSFFAQPGILAAVIGGAVVGLLCAILVVMFIVYRMRKKDEGSYPLEEMKRCPASNPYMKPTHREFFA